MSRISRNSEPSGRPARLPVGYRDRLRILDPDPNYVYRWVNASADQGDRVSIFEAAGYEKVPCGLHKIGNGRVSTPGPDGSVETIPGGGGDKLVLMRIKREWYEQDQKQKQDRVDATERAQRKPPDGFYGSISHSNKE